MAASPSRPACRLGRCRRTGRAPRQAKKGIPGPGRQLFRGRSPVDGRREPGRRRAVRQHQDGALWPCGDQRLDQTEPLAGLDQRGGLTGRSPRSMRPGRPGREVARRRSQSASRRGCRHPHREGAKGGPEKPEEPGRPGSSNGGTWPGGPITWRRASPWLPWPWRGSAPSRGTSGSRPWPLSSCRAACRPEHGRSRRRPVPGSRPRRD